MLACGRLPEATRPRAYISASAVGYHGTSLTAASTEDSPPGNDFLADVCVGWEREATRASRYATRVAVVRTGIVLGPDGGALKPLMPIFRLGLGGRIASGKQWTSWIRIDDQVGIYTAAIDGADGVLNATEPHPVTNANFTNALAVSLHRPAFLPIPAFALKLVFGEGALMMTEGQKVLPIRTREVGYTFKYPHIDAAMKNARLSHGRQDGGDHCASSPALMRAASDAGCPLRTAVLLPIVMIRPPSVRRAAAAWMARKTTRTLMLSMR